jgi:eukaryotic-like serine/threonine-protein kinase
VAAGPEHPLATLPRNPAQPASVRYRSPRVVAMLASRWLRFAIVLGLAGVGVDALWLLSSTSASLDELISIAEMIDLVAVVQLVTLVVGGVLFLAWFHRAYGNLRALGVAEPRYKRGWAIGAWFIPIVNLVLPKQMANDLWRASDPAMQPNDPGWQGRPVAPLLHWWWAFYIVGSAVSAVSGNMIGEAATLDAMNAGVALDAAAQALWIAAAFAGTRVIGLSTERQEVRAGGLRAAGLLPA